MQRDLRYSFDAGQNDMRINYVNDTVAKNYDKRIEINRYRMPDLSDIHNKYLFSRLVYVIYIRSHIKSLLYNRFF